jgi:NhaA family Na+:H+ antiporter
LEAASGVLLVAATLIALLWNNSPWAASYRALWHAPVTVRLGAFVFERPLDWVVNDGLMAVFFFVVGLEIRREMHQGELSEWRRAALPAAAALGGMLAPAGLYLALAGTEATRAGWGVPMATDIAFAIGILTMLGKRVPRSLRVLLLALAVIDDLGAIVVIAFFYSSGIAFSGLVVAVLGLGGVFMLQRLGVRAKGAYLIPAFVTWAGTYAAGVHPTIAGVAVGLATPVRPWRHHVSPADQLIATLHPWVAFVIMPIFALANAGVSLTGASSDAAPLSVALGVGVALYLGKPLGILVAIGVAVKVGVARVPQGLGRRHFVVLGVLAGVGFTMAIFIAQLAFSDPPLLAAAKLGVLGASGLAALTALVMGRLVLRHGTPSREAQPAAPSP